MDVNNNNYIQLPEEEDILRLEIFNNKGETTGQFLEFNLEDIELPLRYQEIIEKDKENRRNIKNQLLIIDKKQDHKGKKLMSSNEEAKIRAMNEFFKKEKEIYNMFLGENGVEKLLNGRELSWTSLEAIDRIIEEQIVPKLEITGNNIMDKIKKKYGDKRDDVIE